MVILPFDAMQVSAADRSIKQSTNNKNNNYELVKGIKFSVTSAKNLMGSLLILISFCTTVG
jgi:hypothetical protein